MFDVSHLPTPYGVGDVQTFEAGGANDWQVWRKPRGKTMGMFTCIGSGSGGGNGFTGIAGSARGGGGGGGSGGMSRITIPLMFLPDLMFVNVATGGDANSAGGLSYISIRPSNAVRNRLLISGTAAATAGGNGTGAAAGSVGAAGTIATIAICGPLANMGVAMFVAGQAGALGGAHTGAVGASTVWANNGHNISGGAGGAGVTTTEYAGGNITSQDWMPTIVGGVATGGNGNAGFYSDVPFGSTGGTGGGSANAVAGGSGGVGEIGSGGGGGGGGTTGGAGGKGGNGLITAVCW